MDWVSELRKVGLLKWEVIKLGELWRSQDIIRCSAAVVVVG